MKKRAITLLEVMIVILLIGLIGGVVSYNLKGTLDKGKAFRSKEGAMKLQDILNLELQTSDLKSRDLVGSSTEHRDNVILCLKRSGLISNPEAFVKDGWGEHYTIVRGKLNSVQVWSSRLEKYNNEHNITSVPEPVDEKEE